MRQAVGLLAVFVGSFFLFFITTQEDILQKNVTCSVTTYESTIDGVSLEPLLKDGSTVRALKDYYSCHAIQKEDMVIFRIGDDALIKIVKGLPGERFLLQKDEVGLWNIIINGEKVKNSEGVPYALNGDHYPILHRSETVYNNIIPEGAYLLLGDRPEGTEDSSIFGFVGKSNIIGKVEIAHAD